MMTDSVCENIHPYRLDTFMLNLEWLGGKLNPIDLAHGAGSPYSGLCRSVYTHKAMCLNWHIYSVQDKCTQKLSLSGCFKDKAHFQSFRKTVEKAKKAVSRLSKPEKDWKP